MALIAAPAHAQVQAEFDVRQPAEPFREAVIDLATVLRASVGGIDAARCGTTAPAIAGRMTADRAFARLLAGSACEAERFDAGIYRLAPRRTSPRPDTGPPPAEVTVTGYRRAMTLGQTPGFTSVASTTGPVDRDDDLTDALQLVPGFSETNLGPGRDKILLRGQSDGVFTGRIQTSVGLYLDDTPITYDAPDPDLLLTDMARIEVLEGPQGALYGEGSISGVVRLVTRPADPDAYADSLAVSGALAQGGAPSARIEAMVNVPLLDHTAAVRLVGYDDRLGGYIDDRALNATDVNVTGREGGRLLLTTRLGVAWRADFLVTAQSMDTANSQYVSGNLGPYTRAVPIPEIHDNDFGDVALTLSGPLDGVIVKASLNHLHHHFASDYDASDIATYVGAAPNSLLRYDDASQVELSTGEITLASPAAQRLRWLAGLYGAVSHEQDSPSLTDLSTSTSDYAEQRQDTVDSRAVFGEVDFDVSARLTLYAGLRLSSDLHQTQSQRVSVLGQAAVSGALSVTHLSHSLSAVYRLTNTLSAYVQAADGYRDGGFNTTFLEPHPADPQSYGGDELNSYEAGLRWSGSAGRSAEIAVSRTLWHNMQSDQLQPSGLPVSVNVGNAAISNIEGRAEWPLGGGFRLAASAQLSDPRLLRADDNDSDDNGHPADTSVLPYVSGFSGDVDLGWTGRVDALPVHAAADLGYASASRLNFGELDDVVMNGFSRLNLLAAVSTGAGEITARLDNALDVHGNSFAYGNPFSLSHEAQTTPLRPRTFWLTWRVAH